MSDEQQAKIKVDWVQMTAGVLTAVTTAVLLSTVGVAGTLIGVAVGSVLGTVGNAFYSHYLALSRRRVAAAKALAETRTRAAARARGPVDEQAQQEHEEQAVEEARAVPWRDVLSGLPWRRLAAATGAVFATVLGAILVFELVSGRALATYTGGTDGPVRTSIPGVGGGQSEGRQDRDQREQPGDPDGRLSEAPEPSPTDPSQSPTPTLTESDEPTVAPTPLETSAPTPPGTEPSVAPAP